MNFHFHLHYKTSFGEQVGIEYFADNNDHLKTFYTLLTFDGENWVGHLELDRDTVLQYKYVILRDNILVNAEWGKYRKVKLTKTRETISYDKWRDRANENNAYLSTAFVDAIFKRKHLSSINVTVGKAKKNILTFCLNSSTIQPHLCFAVIGNLKELGEWKTPILMNDSKFPKWEISIPTDLHHAVIEYKFVIIDPSDHSILIWEDGPNRSCHFAFDADKKHEVVITDDHFRFQDLRWKGAGVAIPVFSLRSHQGMGIGEFSDLKWMIDWAKKTGLSMIQVLPVNDTIANKTWQDSYPYAAISVFALHPLYINIASIAPFNSKTIAKSYDKDLKALNKLSNVDFEGVLQSKFKYLRILFDQEYNTLKGDQNYLDFLKRSNDWLPHYATFCHLRDKYATCNFNQWPQNTVFTQDVLAFHTSKDYPDHKEIEFYYFIQYHAEKQLIEAKDYARAHGVVLKGDLPIGIYRYSCDAWIAPELYNMNEQAGAPPDDYAVLGQNWGFPTYNWSVMAKDGFAWWRRRMQKLNQYFDALRIDHILGFFRIWQIPIDQIEGTLGTFNPRLPYSLGELQSYNISGDLSRYTMPYVTDESLRYYFGEDTQDVFNTFFTVEDHKIKFKNVFGSQLQVSQFISQNPKFSHHEKSLLHLLTEVLLVEEPNTNGQYFNPRITLSTTHSYDQLHPSLKSSFTSLYNDYNYQRHDQFWKDQAMWKLPAILDASDMLICGEDLGMIPASVPGVMKAMNLLSLEIQRMPKGNSQYGIVRNYPYFSVCSPSCHDMSTIRGWWEADSENAARFYHQYMHGLGSAPRECTTQIVTFVVEDHLASPSMLAIFPIQDLVAMDEKLRFPDALAEQINEPSNPKHYWRFRFHLPIETLLDAEVLNIKIKSMVKESGR